MRGTTAAEDEDGPMSNRAFTIFAILNEKPGKLNCRALLRKRKEI